jgi:hypothetical protein
MQSNMIDLLVYAVIFFGLVWLLGAMFSSSKEGGSRAVRGCAGTIVFIVIAAIVAIAIILNGQ